MLAVRIAECQTTENNVSPSDQASVARTNALPEREIITGVFIHEAKRVKPPKPPKKASCYSVIGAKWLTLPVSYVINPANAQSLSESEVTSAIYNAAETWDDETKAELLNDSFTVDYDAHYGVMDGQNVIEFGLIPDSNIIAVTSASFDGTDDGFLEFDILLNTYYTWGDATVDSNVMDIQAIVTHEFGHGIGLEDLYTASCSSATMYIYSSMGETSKRTLEAGDVTGLEKIYGK